MTLKFLVLLAGAFLAGCAVANPKSAPESEKRIKTGYSKETDVIFTPAEWPRALPANIYLPKGTGPWPAVLLIYGGVGALQTIAGR